MATIYNATPGRRQPVRPHRVNPYRGLLRAEEPDSDDLHDVFGLND
jgi:hypothetical protein